MKIFFSGIGGSGVSAIAGFMADKGHFVWGSDRLFDSYSEYGLARILTAKGINIAPQNGSALDETFDLAVFSTAVEKNNPDYLRALELGLPVKMRPDFLSDIVSDFETTAVAGTSGKSTVSGMLSYLMSRLGMAPNFMGGGRVKQFKTANNPGNSITGESRRLVIEACESDGSIVNYKPENTMILNLDLDHHSVGETAGMFEILSRNTKGFVLTSGDDKNLKAANIRKTASFSVDSPSEFRAVDVHYGPLNSKFKVNGITYELSHPGKHNVYNALACIAALSLYGVQGSDIARMLPEFGGIERRFDIHLNDGVHLVVDDYAHNPHKIGSLMRAMQKTGDSVCYIFQPHGFGPTRLMKDAYIETFASELRKTDHLILLPIYYAGGTAARDISSGDLAEGIIKRGCSAEAADDRTLIFTMQLVWKNYVVLGARDETLSELAEAVAERIRRKDG